MKRTVTELYGLTDFFANCGGILGLFMGISCLSIIEVIYHFTLRRCLRRRRQRTAMPMEKQQGGALDQSIPNAMDEECANASPEDNLGEIEK